MSTAYFTARHAFQGDPNVQQLSFTTGTVILVHLDRQHSGWVYGSIPGTDQGGWCPQSYLVPLQQQQTPQQVPTAIPAQQQRGPAAFPAAAQSPVVIPAAVQQQQQHQAVQFPSNPQVEKNDIGFDGPIMGGESTVAAAAGSTLIGVVAPSSSAGEAKSNTLLKNVGKSFKNAGTAVGTSFQKTGSAIATAANKAGSTVSNAASEMGQRMSDMQQQRQQTGVTQKQHYPSKTQDDNRFAKDVGNSAARGAVAGAATRFIMSGGSVTSAVSGAAHGGLFAGTARSAAGWKPFK